MSIERRTVRVDVDADTYGQPWSVRCNECPMKPHADALGQPAPVCAAGLTTNVQGAVILRACKHYQRGSILNAGGRVSVECDHAAPSAQKEAI